jgi:hypothetical protein
LSSSSSSSTSSEKSSKKAKKQKKSKVDKDGASKECDGLDAETPPAYERESIDCIVALTEGASADSKFFPEEICKLAGVKLLSLLAEVGSTTIHSLNLGIQQQQQHNNNNNSDKAKPPVPTDVDESETAAKDETSSSSSTILYYLVSLLNKIVASSTDESSSPVLYNEDIEIPMLKSILDGLYVLHKSSMPASPLPGQEKAEVFSNPVKKHRIMDALTNLSSQCLLSTICAQATQMEVRTVYVFLYDKCPDNHVCMYVCM